MKNPFILLPALCLSLFLNNVAGSSETPTVQIKDKKIAVEIANTDSSREKGLMFRQSLPKDSGMLFIFNSDRRICMWMKNTLIPLSVAFIDAKGKIINLENMSPQTTDLHCSSGDVRYALEMNQGWFKNNGIKAGDILTFRP